MEPFWGHYRVKSIHFYFKIDYSLSFKLHYFCYYQIWLSDALLWMKTRRACIVLCFSVPLINPVNVSGRLMSGKRLASMSRVLYIHFSYLTISKLYICPSYFVSACLRTYVGVCERSSDQLGLLVNINGWMVAVCSLHSVTKIKHRILLYSVPVCLISVNSASVMHRWSSGAHGGLMVLCCMSHHTHLPWFPVK